MIILCLCGWSNSGKDTVANILKKYNFTQLAFANPLKDYAAQKYGFPREWADSQLHKTFYWKYAGENKTIRQYLIDLGLQLKQEYGPTVFIDIIINQIRSLPEDAKIVISDLRYPDEYKRIMEEFPEAKLCKVLRTGQHQSPVSDPSENYHLVWRVNYLILNTGSDFDELEKEIVKIFPTFRNELSTS